MQVQITATARIDVKDDEDDIEAESVYYKLEKIVEEIDDILRDNNFILVDVDWEEL